MNYQSAILKTLCYADIFDYPLSAPELFKYLIAPSRVGQQNFFIALNQLELQGKIKAYNKLKDTSDIVWYSLADRGESCQIRLVRSGVSKGKLKKTRNIVRKLYQIESIEAVFLTGSLAMSNAAADDDIDIMIVTKPGQLWQTRLRVTVILEASGLRRKPEDAHVGVKARDKICANMYLDSQHLRILPKQRNLYTAHEVVQVQPIFDKAAILSRFWTANQWVKTFLPHSMDANNLQLPNPEFANSSYLTNWLELASFSLQKWYMHSKVTNEIIHSHRAMFHPRDTASYVLNQYQQRLDTYLK